MKNSLEKPAIAAAGRFGSRLDLKISIQNQRAIAEVCVPGSPIPPAPVPDRSPLSPPPPSFEVSINLASNWVTLYDMMMGVITGFKI